MLETLAGVPFVALAHHDLRMFRSPGVYVLARRSGEARQILHVGHSDEIASVYGGPTWAEALEAGMNEVLVNLTAAERLDRLQIVAMVRRAYGLVASEGADGGAREAG